MSKKTRKKKRNGLRPRHQGTKPIFDGIDLDKIFCINAKKYNLPKIFLMAVAKVESAFKVKAYRFEPAFWTRYLEKNPLWKDRDPKEVSASYGLMQLMYVVAWEMGFRGTGEDLYNPVINIELGARLLRKHLDNLEGNGVMFYTPWALALARYNAGAGNNPNEHGMVPNPQYVGKVVSAYKSLIGEVEDCNDNENNPTI